jgi:hypothetical protein
MSTNRALTRRRWREGHTARGDGDGDGYRRFYITIYGSALE